MPTWIEGNDSSERGLPVYEPLTPVHNDIRSIGDPSRPGRACMASQIERSTVRLKAKECERLAEAMSDPDSREQLRSAARQWLEVVEQVELLDASDLNHP